MEKKEQLEKQISSLKKMREDLGMNRTEFSQYIGIPLRTLEEWEAGRRQMPEYVLRLMAYYTKVERLLVEQEIELNIPSEIKVFRTEHFNETSKEK